VVALRESTGISKYIIEIKPSRQVALPVKGNKRYSTLVYETKRYAQNQAKWKAAKEWCSKHNYKFLILTEKELGINK